MKVALCQFKIALEKKEENIGLTGDVEDYRQAFPVKQDRRPKLYEMISECDTE